MAKLQGWIGPNEPYLILHSRFRGNLDRPWQVVRCWTNTDEREVLFNGDRDKAVAFMKKNWDCNNS